MRSALTLVLGILLAIAAPGLRAQAKPGSPGGAKTAPKATGKAAPQARRAAAPAVEKRAAKPANRKAAKAPRPVETAMNPDAAAAGPGEKIARRDPFESLVARQQAQANAGKNLPPGIAGLQVSTLKLDGIVKAPNGMIAVVTNPQERTYFLREGDQLYDGRVEKIAMDGVSFHEIGKDAFGKPVERQVNKRIYSSAGEQQ
ncbi:MAG: pilus assembly protein PilP [Candidatus Acidiferrum sp.]